MRIVILTNKRKPEYIHQCIKDIRREYKGTIDLMISGKETDYLKKYKGKGFVWHRNTEEGLIKPWQKACRGYANCLKLGKGEGVLVIEDDTGFKEGWYKQFLKNKEVIEKDAKQNRYILSLGKALDGSIVNPGEQTPQVQVFLYRVNLMQNPKGLNEPPIAFIICWFDSHAVYFPPDMPFDDLSAFINKYGVEYSSMHDILIGYYMFRKFIPIYISQPFLALNIGAYNTSVGSITDRNDTEMTKWDFEK
ncbi:MAG: hypothetical protein C5B43_02330 [Verrucomicrobia bacterium]|nr:MAG: hypothetical protein C5B43_02330 [Verrucomicrobiota bacterium]